LRRSVAILPRFAACLLGFVCIEAAVFHSGFYASILEPASSAGTLETLIRNERNRAVDDRNQVLAVGDSRMGMLPRMANQAQVGYTFASIALGGTTPRCWYYMLRDTDPSARRYRAVVLTVDDYELRDLSEDIRNRISDLHYLIARLRLSDLAEFSGSYPRPADRWTAARGILLKGLVCQRDFQEFLLHPAARLAMVKLYRAGSAGWFYDFQPDSHSLAGLEVDWGAKKIQYPPGLTETERRFVADVLLRPEPPQTGWYRAYLRHWFGRIVEHYRGSGTKVIVLRLPRAPVLPPGQPVPAPPRENPLRALAAAPGVVLLDEHRFDELERPELFGDPLHLNAEGIRRFSRILAEEARRILGPPAGAHAL